MFDKPGQLDKFDQLRDQVQKLLAQWAGFSSQAPADILELIQELQIHQVELGIQNEELKQSQQELSEFHDEYEKLYEFAPCAYITMDAKGRITRRNLAGVRLLGAANRFLPRTGFSQYISSGWEDAYSAALKKAEKTHVKQSVELLLKKEDGSPVWVQADIQADRNETGALIQSRMMLVEITQRVVVEHTLKASEGELSLRKRIAETFLTVPDPELYSAVLNVILDTLNSPQGLFGYLDQKGDLVCPSVTSSNWGQCRTPGKCITFPRQLWGNSIWKKAVTEKRAFFSNPSHRTPAGNLPVNRSLAVPILYQNDVIGLLFICNKPEDFDKEDIRLLEGIAAYIAPILSARIARSLHEIRQGVAEEALRESEVRFRNLIEGSIQGIMIHRDLKPLFVNKSFADIYGYTVEEILEMDSIIYLVHEIDQKRLLEYLDSRFRGDGAPNQYEYRGTRKDGSTIWLDHKVRVVEWFGAMAVQSTVFDITSVKKAQKALLMAYADLECTVAQRTQELSNTNATLIETDHQRKSLSRELINLLEKDRHRISMELHDHIGQSLTSLKLSLELAREQLTVEGAGLENFLNLETERVVQLLKDVKRISHGLRPGTLDRLGLVPSLRNLFLEFKNQANVPIKFFVRRIPKKLHPEKELAIYRIIQEAINNVLKHAQAENIHVSLVGRKGVISLSVEDDGRGFALEKATLSNMQKMPLGLLIMKERTEQFGGDFSIDTKTGDGTVVIAEIPG